MFKKRSFFEKLTGITSDNDEYEVATNIDTRMQQEIPIMSQEEEDFEEEMEGQLAIDVYHTPNEIIIQTMVAGVRPDDLNISITREIVTIQGYREAPQGIANGDYFHNELYWGNFSRSIDLPQEIEPEEAEAIEKHGLLLIRLPKIDKHRSHKIKIKSV